jgi:hypothetical protein
MTYLIVGLLVMFFSAALLIYGYYYLGIILFAIGTYLGIKGNRKYYRRGKW